MEFKSIIVVFILFFSILIAGWNFGFGATNIESTSSSTLNTGTKPRSNGDFDWGSIEVLSETIAGQNNNINSSFSSKIVIENGIIYVVWGDSSDINGAGSDSDIFYRRYDGISWSDIQIISEPLPGQNLTTDGSYCPDIAVENGKIYVVWYGWNNTNYSGSDWDIFYRCNLSGSNWEDIQAISEPVPGNNLNIGSSFSPGIAVDNGKIYTVWRDHNNTDGAGTDADIFFRSNLTGNNWEAVQVISEPVAGQNFHDRWSYNPDIVVENNKIYIVWMDQNDTNGAGLDNDIFFICNLTGSDWENIQVISEPVPNNDFNTAWSDDPAIAVENGKIYVVWRDRNETNNAGIDHDIFYRANLTGSNWETVQIISEPVSGYNFSQGECYYPAIEVENSRICVAWQDSNNTMGAGNDNDIFYRYNITNSNWEDIQVISEPLQGSDINILGSKEPDIAVYLNRCYFVWSDQNNTDGAGTDSDIFFKWHSFSPLFLKFPNVNPIIGNTSTYFNFTVKYFQIENITPTKITINISGSEYSMLEVEPGDTNYTNGKNYYFNTTHLDIDAHKFQIYASDSNVNDSTAIINLPFVYNTAPNIITLDNQTVFEDEYYEVSYEYEDIDIANVGQSISWNYSSNASWLTFDNGTTVLKGTPANDDVGSYWVNISINDTLEIDYTNFTLTVINVNNAPVITTADVTIATEDELYAVDYEVIDVDTLPEDLSWYMNTNGGWLGFETATALLHGTPLNDDVGVYWVNITINDTINFDFTNFTLTVLNINDRPTITTDDVLTALSGKLYNVDYNATDIDSPVANQTWELVTNASGWLTLDTATGVLSGTPTTDDVGWYNINLTIDDGDGGQAWREFVLTVSIGNYPPKIITDDVLYATVNKLYNVDYEATDVDSPLAQLVWSLNTNATWLIIEKNQGILTGTPKPDDVGWYWVNVTVGDGEGGSDVHNFTLNVYSTANQPPEITTKDNLTAVVNLYYAVDYDATDDYTPVNELRWYLDTNASWLNIGTTTGILSGTPKPGDEGFYWVEISVTDLEEGWDRHNFTVRVLKDTAGDETIRLSNPTFTPSEGDTDTEFTFSIHYRNTDNRSPTYVQLIIDGDIYTMELQPGENATNGVYACTLKLSAGTHSYYFVASDGTATELSEDFTTPGIEKVGGEDTHYEFYRDWLIWIVIIVIVTILILGAILIRVKKNKRAQEEPAKELPTPTPSAEAPSIPEPMVIGQPEEQLTGEELEE